MKKSRLLKWYEQQRTIPGHWAESDYELAASIDNGELQAELPDWLRYDPLNNTIYDIEIGDHIVIWLD